MTEATNDRWAAEAAAARRSLEDQVFYGLMALDRAGRESVSQRLSAHYRGRTNVDNIELTIRGAAR